MPRPALVLLCGPSFAGKSMLAAALAARGWAVVSLDELNARRGLYGGELLLVLRVDELEVRRRIAANDGRRRGVAPEVLEAHLASFEWPGADEPHAVVDDVAEAARRLSEES